MKTLKTTILCTKNIKQAPHAGGCANFLREGFKNPLKLPLKGGGVPPLSFCENYVKKSFLKTVAFF